MSAGTLTLTNNSAAVTGSGTALATELSAGDFIVVTVGGIPYTLPVKTINSATSLTLVSNYTGPTQSGAAWYAVPRVAMNLVTAALVVQNTEALRGLNYDKQNWQQLFTGTGTITVKLPDQTIWTGPAWNALAEALANTPSITDVRNMIDALAPVGMMIHWPSATLPDNSSLSVKYLRLNGAAFSTTTYPKLAVVYPSGVLPDMRADVARGYDDGRGIDQGRALLSEQLDAIQNITATLNTRGIVGISPGVVFSASGALSLASASGASVLGIATPSTSVAMDVLSFNASNVARTATETRMRNMTWNMIVRAS